MIDIDEKASLDSVIKITREILQIQDLDVLLERMLTESRKFTHADAGSIYIIEEGGKLKFSYTQNTTLQRKLPPGKKLIYNTFSIPINNKSIAGYVAIVGSTVNIPDAYNITEDKPYSFDQTIDETSGYHTVSMITVPIKTYRGKMLGAIQLINALGIENNIIEFTEQDEKMLEHFADNAAIAIERAQMTRAMIMRMTSLAELRDPGETQSHVNRVAAYSVEIYEAWAHKKGITEREILHNRDLLRMAALLHDVGKVAIPDTILNKPSPLTQEEREIMQSHTTQGAKLFQDSFSDFDDATFAVTLNHHEKWDGSGYPGHIDVKTGKALPGYEKEDGKAFGKSGEEIPIFGRIVALADVFDALSSKRVYKKPWDDAKVLEAIQAGSGKQFDPDVVAAFFSCIDMLYSIRTRYPD